MNADLVPEPEIVLACAIDDAWVPHFATCVSSIAASRGSERLRFLMLVGPSLSATSVERAREFVEQRGMAFEALHIPEEQIETLPETVVFSRLVWYRTLLPDLLPDLDRVLALDADTLVMQSLLPLWQHDLGDRLLAAVAHPITPEHAPRVRSLGIDPVDSYFNAGVMLMNLKAMRDEDLGGKAIALGHERGDELICAEQDALNMLVTKRWDKLHPRWNAMSYLWLTPDDADGTYSDVELTGARVSPAVVHFEGFQTVKPWFYRSVHPLREVYRDFRRRTPWPLESLENKTVGGALLRPLPIRAQYAVVKAKARVADRIASRTH